MCTPLFFLRRVWRYIAKVTQRLFSQTRQQLTKSRNVMDRRDWTEEEKEEENIQTKANVKSRLVAFYKG